MEDSTTVEDAAKAIADGDLSMLQTDDDADVETSAESSETPSEESPKTEAEPSPEPVKEGEKFDPFATLGEDEPQAIKDAAAIAKKWDKLTPEQQQEKVEKLSHRKDTLEALAEKLGKNVDKLAEPKPDSRYEEKIAALEAKLEEVQEGTEFSRKQAERHRFVTEVAKWAQHNNLDPDTTKALTDPEGDLYSSFNTTKFDPSSGEPMGFNGRLKQAIVTSSSIKRAVAKANENKVAEATIEGLKAKLPDMGSGKTVSKDIMALEGEEFLDEFDKLAGVRKW